MTVLTDQLNALKNLVGRFKVGSAEHGHVWDSLVAFAEAANQKIGGVVNAIEIVEKRAQELLSSAHGTPQASSATVPTEITETLQRLEHGLQDLVSQVEQLRTDYENFADGTEQALQAIADRLNNEGDAETPDETPAADATSKRKPKA